jgi:transcriptional regulator with XRE-family HTH domain
VSTVADRIRQRRQELGLSLRAAACEGVSAAHISRIETGDRQPSMKTLRALAARLDVSVHWLETGADDPVEELARLVLDTPDRPLPPRARTLARTLLRDRGRAKR